MLSIVIPTLEAGACLERTLRAVADPGFPVDLIVADGGSTDATLDVAARFGARTLTAPRGRGAQLAAGAGAARGEWLLFLHADTVLEAGWRAAVTGFAIPQNRFRAAVFTFALDDQGPQARRLERMVAWRTRVLGLPYGDQGLLMSRDFHGDLGGFRPLPLMEDVDMIRRVGRKRLTALDVKAVTSAERFRRQGYVRRSTLNLTCLGLYLLGVPPARIERIYR